MAKRARTASLRNVTEKEATEALLTQRAFLNNDRTVTAAAARAAQRVISAYQRQRAQERLKSEGHDVGREIDRILKSDEDD
jgi:hypothetical protein